MSINKRGGNVTPVKPRAAKTAPAASEEGATSVTVQRSFTIPGDGEYESQKVGIIVSAPTYEEASALCEQYMTSEFERSSAQFAAFRAAADEMAEELGAEDVEGGEEGAEEGGDVTPDDIRKMSRKELEALNDDNDLGLEPSDYAKNKGGNAKFAEAIIEAAGLESEEGGEEGEEEAGEEGEEEAVGEEGGDLTADDIRAMERSELLTINKDNELGLKTKGMSLDDLREAIIEAAGLEDEGGEESGEEGEEEGEEEAASEEEGELTADDVRAMSRNELIALNKEHELGIKSKGMSDEDFAEAVIEAAGLEDAGAGEEEGEEGEEGEEEVAEDTQEGYSRKELEALKPADLKAIYKEWGIKDKYPAGAEAVAKKKAINRIMQFQDTGK